MILENDQPVVTNTNDFYSISAQPAPDNSPSPKTKRINWTVLILPLILAVVGATIYFVTRSTRQTTETRTRAEVERLRMTLTASSEAQDGNVNVNDEFTISVLATNEGAFSIAAASVSATFTNSKLQLLSFQQGTFFSSVPENLTNKANFLWSDPPTIALANQRGRIAAAIGAYCTTQSPWTCYPQTESGILLILRFKATQNGEATIQLTNPEAADITNCNPSTPEGLAACSTNVAALGTPAQLQITVGSGVTSTLTSTTSPTESVSIPPTATVTLSPTPAGGTVTKNILFTLQSVTTHRRDATASVILKQDTEIVHQEIVSGTSNNNGVYTATLHNVTPGTYTVYIKGPSHLARKKADPVVIDDSSPAIDFSATPLMVGDLVGNPISFGGQDGIFNIVDFQPFIFIFRTGSSHQISEYPNRQNTDLNMDGVIDITDLIPMISNYRNHIYEEEQ